MWRPQGDFLGGGNLSAFALLRASSLRQGGQVHFPVAPLFERDAIYRGLIPVKTSKNKNGRPLGRPAVFILGVPKGTPRLPQFLSTSHRTT